MFALLGRIYKAKEVIPVNLLNMPLWIYDTYRDRRSQESTDAYQSTSRGWSWLPSPSLEGAIFVIGSPRSGTTFLGDSLSVLPEISYHHEPVLTKAATRYVYAGLWSEKFAARVFRMTYRMLMRMNSEQHLRFSEKTPSNGLIVPFLSRVFPDAVFIHITRDGRDAALSLARKPWYTKNDGTVRRRDADGYRVGSGARFYIESERKHDYETTNDLHRCIWLWRRYLEEIEKGLKTLPATRVYEVKYEELVQRPEVFSEEILDFIGIDNPESREIYRQTLISQASIDSVDRWKTELTHDQHVQMLEEAGEQLGKSGYDISPSALTGGGSQSGEGA